jgi:RNA polymerase sigma-70 factor (ECF subfamily)
VSLLERLRQATTDQEAWREFVDRYAPTIHSWCRRWGLQQADAQDVTQAVLLILARRLKTFTYDPAASFRGWLHTVTRHTWAAFVEDRQQAPLTSGDRRVTHALETLEAREDLVCRLKDCFDHELLEQALERVRTRVEPHTWEAFRLTALEQVSAGDVASKLEMKVATVYVARSKVQNMVRTEVQRLEGNEVPSPEA